MEGPAEREAAGRSAAALARLLHRDCARLLELYREREHFSPDHDPAGEPLLQLTPHDPSCGGAAEAELRRVSSALRSCAELLEQLIGQEVEEVGEELQGEFETLRRTVMDRITHLNHCTSALMKTPRDPEPHPPCVTGQDETEGSSSFAVKIWTLRVLLELIHWTGSASQTLQQHFI